MNKKDVVRVLEKIALYLELKGENSFRVAAYRRAANGLEKDVRSLNEIDRLESIPGIGKGTAQVINEFIKTGRSNLLMELEQEIPKGLLPLLQLPGLGGKRVARLYHELDIVDLSSLQKACEEKRIRHLPGFGEKLEKKIAESIRTFNNRPQRLPIADVISIVSQIESQLARMQEICCFSVAGSYRRLSETVKDVDFVIATKCPKDVANQLIKLEDVVSVIAHGDTKVTVKMESDIVINVDFRMVAPQEFSTALHHFTGSEEHNIQLRQLAKKQGEKISEYGIVQRDGNVLTFPSEERFFHHFKLHYIPPELRVGDQELERFKMEVDLIQFEQIKGDLHMHSTWSDGAHTIEEMAMAARKLGYEYIAITDHSQFLKVANGLTPDRLKLQQEEIARINEKYTDFTILSGIEMDILPDGTLDFEDDVLESLDFVIASIHSGFSQNKDKIMQRLIRALRNHHVDLIAHPTGRLIGKRPGYDVDIEMLIEVARETGTALELNSSPKRLDLAPKWVEKAQEKQVKLMINSDAHSKYTLDFIKMGVASGRKGWLKKDTVLNTRSLAELRNDLQRGRKT